MLKKEIIWREILYQGIEKNNRQFQQKTLAADFGFSLSTVFNALKVPRKIGAVKVSGRNFVLVDPLKLLYLWASHRNLGKEIVYKTHTDGSVQEIEGLMPKGIIYATYSAFKHRLKEPLPADYDKVYVYGSLKSLKEIQKRFPARRGYENLVVLKTDPFLKKYGPITPLAQTFVDLWNLPEWYARDFYLALEQKIHDLLP
jgi:hypothetical protein